MTEKELKQYKSLVRQAARLNKMIEAEEAKDLTEVMGKVKGSSSSFPYIEQCYSVPMYEPIECEAYWQRVNKLKAKLNDKEKKIKEIETFIDGISDETANEVFTYCFIDGMTQKEAAAIVDKTQSWVSDLIKRHSSH